MLSRAPVDSPTAIICVTIGGNTFALDSGSAMVCPSETPCLTPITAFSITLLPAVLAVMFRPSRMGTPLLMRVPSVRVNFATATFLKRTPTMGSNNIILSITFLPISVRLNWVVNTTIPTTHASTMSPPVPPRKWLILIISCVGAGRSPPSCANILLKVGTTKTMIIIITRIATEMTTAG